MDAINAIHGRRSIRRFKAGDVTEDQVTELLKAAMAAPSARNRQPWEFIVIRDRGVLDSIREFHSSSAMLADASLAIAVCGDIERTPYDGPWMIDCAAATQNILLAAHALGLGAVWLGLWPNEKRFKPLAELLGMPGHIIPLSLIAIGHPDEEKGPSGRFDASRVHLNRW